VKLPPDAYIDPRKITDYLLKPLEDSDKSAFLARAGYTEENPEDLLSDIRKQLLPLEAVDLVRSPSAGSMRSMASSPDHLA